MAKHKRSEPVDAFSERLGQYFDRAAIHGRAVVFGAVAVGLLFLALIFWVAAERRQYSHANEALTKSDMIGYGRLIEADQQGMDETLPYAKRIQAYQEVWKNFGGTDAGKIARYRAALLQFKDAAETVNMEAKRGKMRTVAEQTAELQQKSLSDLLYVLTAELRGLALESIGGEESWNEALEVYTQAEERYPGSFLAPKFAYHKAKIYYQLGNHQQANSALESALVQAEDVAGRQFQYSQFAMEWPWLEAARFLKTQVSTLPVADELLESNRPAPPTMPQPTPSEPEGGADAGDVEAQEPAAGADTEDAADAADAPGEAEADADADADADNAND